MERFETPFRPAREVSAGRFVRHNGYTNWRPRGSGDWLLIYTDSGAGRYVAGDRELVSAPGDVTLWEIHAAQDYSTHEPTGKWGLMFAHFTPHARWDKWMAWPVRAPGLRWVHLSDDVLRKGIERAMRRLIHVRHSSVPGATELAMNALEEALLWAYAGVPDHPWQQIDPRIRRVMGHIDSELRQPFVMDDVARVAGLSVSRFAHLFKEQVGKSPQRYAEERKMMHARELLRTTGLTVSEISEELGFDSPFYFTTRFRRITGSTPTEYRRVTR